MIYKITKQYGKGKEISDRQFSTLKEAKDYMQQNAESDAAMKTQVIYRVYEFDEVVYEVDSSKIDISSQFSSGDSSGGKSSSATFRPTPLATAPRPAGMPPKSIIDPEEDKE
jgi:hypothetical protein